MGQVYYNLSFSVCVERVQWSVAIDTPLTGRFFQVTPSALDEMKSKFL